MEGRRSSWTSARAVRATAHGGSKTPPPLRQWRRGSGSGSSGSSSTDSSERLRQWRRALDPRKQRAFSRIDTGATNTTAVVSSESDASDSVGSDVSFSCEGTSSSNSGELPSSSSGSSSSSSDDRRESYLLTDLSASSEGRSGSSSSGGSSPLSVVVEEESSSSLSGNNPQYTRRPRGRQARASRHAEAKFAHSISTNNASSSMRDSLDQTNHALREESSGALESSSSSISGNDRRPTGRRVRAQVLEKFAHSISINDASSSMRDSLDQTNHAMREESSGALESSSSFFAGLRRDPMDKRNHRLRELSTDFSGPSTDVSSEVNVLPAHPYHSSPKRELDEIIRPSNGPKVIDESARTEETEQTIPTSNHGTFQQLRSVSNLRREVELEAQRRAEVEAWKIEQWELQMELQREREQVRTRQGELRKRALMAREEERRSQGQLEEQEQNELWQRDARQTSAEIKSSDRRQWQHQTSTYRQRPTSHAHSYLHLVLFLASLICTASLAVAKPSDLRSTAERMALGLFGVAAVLSSLAFVGLRCGAAGGRAMTAPIEVDVPHVGVLEFQSLACIATVVIMAVWTVIAILVLLDPGEDMAVAGTEVWNANLFFGTWVGFATACFLFADGCVACNNNGAGAPLNPKARARREIARGWILQLISSIVLVAFSAALMGGPVCRSGGYLDEESAPCARVVCGVVLGVLGMLLAATYFVARAVLAHRAARAEANDASQLVWNGRVDRTSFVLASLALCVFAANAGLLTAPASGSVGGEPCNLFVSSWICFGLSLYLALRHVEMWSAQPTVRRRVPESTSLVPFGYEQKPSAGTSAITEESPNSSYSDSSSSGSLGGPLDRFAYGDEEVGAVETSSTSSSSESSSSCESVSFETLLEKAEEAPPSPVSSKDRERPDPEMRRGRPQSYALSSGNQDLSVESSAQRRDPSGKTARRRQKTTKAPLSPQEHISMISSPPLGNPHHHSDEMLSSSDREMHQSDSALPRVTVTKSFTSSKSAPLKSTANYMSDQEVPEPVVSGPEGSTTADESIDTLSSGRNRTGNLNSLRSVKRTCSISVLPRAEAIQREEEELFGHISTSTFLDRQRNERIDRRESLFKDPNGLQAALTENMEVQTARDQRIRGRDMQAMDGVGESPSDQSQSTASTDSSPGDLSGKPRQIQLDRSVSVISSLQEDENSLDLTMTTYDPLESKAASSKFTKASGGTGDTPHPSATGGGKRPNRKSFPRNKPARTVRDEMLESVSSSHMSSGVSSIGPQTDEDSEAHSFAKTPGRHSNLGFFSQLDINGEGVIDKQEMKEMFWRKLGKELSDSEMDRVFNVLDEDGDGHIDLAEFQDWCLKNFDGSPRQETVRKESSISGEGNGNEKDSPPSRKRRPKAKQRSKSMDAESESKRHLPPPPARKGSSYTKTTQGSATRSRSSNNTPSSDMDKGFTARVYPPPPVRSSSSSNGPNSSGTDTPLSDLSDGAAQAVRTRRPPPPLRSSSSSFAITVEGSRRSSATQSSVDEMVAAALRQAQQMKETHEAKQKSPASSEEVPQLGPKPALGNAIPKSVERILLEETPKAKQQKSPAALGEVKMQGPSSAPSNIPKSCGVENGLSDGGNDDIVDSLVKEALSHARGVAQRRQSYSEEESSDSGSWPHDC